MSFEQIMSEDEVRSSYKFAKNPKRQVRILAECNGVMPKVIRRVLEGQTWEAACERRHPKSRYVRTTEHITWTAEKVAQLRSLRMEGYRIKEIAGILKCSESTVWGACGYYGIYKPGYDGKKKSRK